MRVGARNDSDTYHGEYWGQPVAEPWLPTMGPLCEYVPGWVRVAALPSEAAPGPAPRNPHGSGSQHRGPCCTLACIDYRAAMASESPQSRLVGLRFVFSRSSQGLAPWREACARAAFTHVRHVQSWHLKLDGGSEGGVSAVTPPPLLVQYRIKRFHRMCFSMRL